MLKGHFKSAGASIDYGGASRLFPVSDLDATVLQYRDAQLVLSVTGGADAIVVAPTNLATSYALAQHALTAITIKSLPQSVQSGLDEQIKESLETFDLIQIGKWNTDSTNHSLAEFTSL